MNVPFVVLIILDGWGIAPPGPGNAISQASTPNINRLWSVFPHTSLDASGEAVGLPKNEAGNTETGHLNLGAGQIIYQDLARINMAVADGSFFRNEAFLQAVEHARKNNSKLHLMGLWGSGGVHSSREHLFALLRLCKEQSFDKVFLHLFTDGRDSPPNSAIDYTAQLEEFIKTQKVGTIATLMGRYWAMDRDLRWDRTEKAYFALTRGNGQYFQGAKQALHASYENGVTDEFLNASILVKEDKPIALVQENDAVIFFNFRIDRPRQLTHAFVFEDFKKETEMSAFDFDPYAEKYFKKTLARPAKTPVFERGDKIRNLFFVTMTRYGEPSSKYVKVAFPPTVVKLPLGAVVSERNLRQLRLCESEKERFVTFYFNGQQDIQFPGEDREILPSPGVPTYDKAPEMSAPVIAEKLLAIFAASSQPEYALIVVNFANADMVGHTGNIEAAKVACGVVDTCVGKIIRAVDISGGVTIITADHGNAEEMLTESGAIETEHSRNQVPFIVVGKQFLDEARTLQSGILADVAPTILKIMGLPQPTEMTGRALI